MIEARADEFTFHFAPPGAAAHPFLPDCRMPKSRHNLTVRIVSPAGFVPHYQMSGRISGYTNGVQRPNIGFSVRASSAIHLKPITRDAALFGSPED